jgi:anti-sigma factor RsiW
MTKSGFKELPCDLLDEFLGRELTVAERRAFEDHLPECPSCRDAVADWQALCGTLRSATRPLETPPAALLERIERESAVPEEPVATGGKTWRVAALVAASLLAAALFRGLLRPASPPASTRKPLAVEGATAMIPPPLKVEFSGDVIGVPIDIGDPKVTVVWVYPEAKLAQGGN